MKVLINCALPFALAHGGWQIQIQRTAAALEAIGLPVEFTRWWDDQQAADVIHYCGRMPADQIKLAHQKGIKVVMAELLTAQGSRSPARLRLQQIISRTMASVAPRQFVGGFNWESYRLADAVMVNTSWEGQIAHRLFGAVPEKIHVVPNGVEEVFLHSRPVARGPWLVCSATITKRKRILELAEASVRAQTPLWVLGKPYSESDSYVQQFKQLADAQPQFIRYEGQVGDRSQLAQIYREARGFVLLSSMETRSLAAEEAAACECPLLLSDLPWARTVFGQNARYCPVTSVAGTARVLRQFYDQCPSLKPPPKPATWQEVALQLKAIYEQVLSTSR
jgi:glycosyltransferase involved in cell wall biosynthesis